MEYEMVKVAEDDPWRCQASTPKGQCPLKATVLGGTCPAHGGNVAVNCEEKRQLNNYRVDKFQAKLNRHATSPRLKTLGDEVAILRMLLEEQLNKCDDAHDLVLRSHLISDLVVKIEKVVKSCHSLENSLGGLLDKQAILVFAGKVIEVIAANVKDEVILNEISNGIVALVKDE